MALETLRRDLEANNGMPGLEILRPDEVDAAVRIFYPTVSSLSAMC